MPPIDALLMVGAVPRCGKTALAAGLAGALRALGFSVQTVKPLVFTESGLGNTDQDFMDRINRPLVNLTTLTAPSPHEVSNLAWNRLLDSCKGIACPTLIESPGTVASPLKFVNDETMEAVDLARILGIPMLVVTRKSSSLIGDIVPTLAYLQDQSVPVVGWIAVETTLAHTPHWDEDALYVSSRFRVQHLGTIPYSPSISVELNQQGNLIRLTESNVDLLPLQQALHLMVW